MNNNKDLITGISLVAVLAAAVYFIYTNSNNRNVPEMSESTVDEVQTTESNNNRDSNAQPEDTAQTTQEQNENTNQVLYTALQVSEHSTPENCWVIINNSVYDLSNFNEKHPGGPMPIEFNCGKDATQGFKTRMGKGPHPEQAQQFLETLKIGVLSE